jgi:Outer membrane protein beta-barrel domain
VKRVASLAALLGALSVPYARAADGGVYIGVGAGQASIQVSGPAGAGTVDLNSHKGYKAILGYRMGAIPLVDLAAEATYTSFGSASQTSLGQNVEYKLHGPSVAGLLIFPLGPLDLYGKVGTLAWSSDKNIGGASSTRTGTDAFYGAGVGFRVLKLGFRVEYERYDVPSADRVQMVSGSIVLQF